MEKLSDFLKRSSVKQQLKKPITELLANDMNRDPSRPIYYDKNYFISPADGFVIYNKIVDPDEDIINVKGGEYTVNTLLREEIKEKCLVIGIFMTVLDVHVNRLPTSGFVSYEKLPTLKVTNLSMRPIEKAILEQANIDHNEMRYSFYNEAMKNKVLVPYLNQHYWILQIADFEVDVIVAFGEQNEFYTQCSRFSLVRLGSQVDLIIPLKNKNIQFQSLIPEDGIYHVIAGEDQLVRILR
jgi:phosphatidylserine decarboxylase